MRLGLTRTGLDATAYGQIAALEKTHPPASVGDVIASANRSSEPMAYEDGDALASLTGIADAFLIGERPIARRVDDSVARVTSLGPAILRRARGLAPQAVATLPTQSFALRTASLR